MKKLEYKILYYLLNIKEKTEEFNLEESWNNFIQYNKISDTQKISITYEVF